MISGYAAVYYDESDPGTQFEFGPGQAERIMPGAFDRFIEADTDLLGLFNHDKNLILGRRSAGTLRIASNERGLRYTIKESDSQISRDVALWQSNGELLGSSFAFYVVDESYRKEGDGLIREINDVDLLDVGPVSYPAYSGTEGVSHRFVSPEGRCLVPSEHEHAEVRSRFKSAKNRLLERQNVLVRSRLVLTQSIRR